MSSHILQITQIKDLLTFKKSRDLVTVSCFKCEQSFERTKHRLAISLRLGKLIFCSHKCACESRIVAQNVNCNNCNKSLTRAVKKDQNVYCSSACAAVFNNRQFPKRTLTKVCKGCSAKVYSDQVFCSSGCLRLHNDSRRKPKDKKAICHKNKLFSQRIKIRAVAYKGGKCIKCGYDKYTRALAFHHIDPLQKEFNVGSMQIAWGKLKQELDKCVLLCINCHTEEHNRLHLLKALPAFSPYLATSAHLLICKDCSRFYKFDSTKGHTKTLCNTCHIKQLRKTRKTQAIDYLGGKCSKCGYFKCPNALHFHHREPVDKSFQISKAYMKSWTVIVAELDKCDILCGNCHAEIHSHTPA